MKNMKGTIMVVRMVFGKKSELMDQKDITINFIMVLPLIHHTNGGQMATYWKWKYFVMVKQFIISVFLKTVKTKSRVLKTFNCINLKKSHIVILINIPIINKLTGRYELHELI